MEQDRFQKNQTVFIIGMIALMISLFLLILCLYLLPNLLFGWHYNTPAFVVYMTEWFQSNYGYTESSAPKVIFFILLGFTLFFGAIAYFSSNRIENDIYQNDLPKNEVSKEKKEASNEGKSLVVQMLMIIILIFLIGGLFQWLMFSSPPQEISQNNQYNNPTNRMIDGT